MKLSKTFSRYTTEAARGTHVFEIAGYSLWKGRRIGEFFQSGTFTIGGYDWSIRVYLNGELERSDYISISLELMSKCTGSAGVWTSFSLHLVNQAPGKVSPKQPMMPLTMMPQTMQFRPSKSSFRQINMNRVHLKKSEIEESSFLKDDRLVVECVLTVFNDISSSNTVMVQEIEVPPSDLPEHLGRLLEDGEGADVTFVVKGESFPVHRMVLAMRSRVFKAELYGSMREKDMCLITIDDMQPGVFRALLHYIYTDSLPTMDDLNKDDSREMLRHLLIAADRYDIERMKVVCEHGLFKSLDVETVATTFALADQHNCGWLKDACIGFIFTSCKMQDVVASQGYMNLKRSCPTVLAELLEKAVVWYSEGGIERSGLGYSSGNAGEATQDQTLALTS